MPAASWQTDMQQTYVQNDAAFSILLSFLLDTTHDSSLLTENSWLGLEKIHGWALTSHHVNAVLCKTVCFRESVCLSCGV